MEVPGCGRKVLLNVFGVRLEARIQELQGCDRLMGSVCMWIQALSGFGRDFGDLAC